MAHSAVSLTLLIIFIVLYIINPRVIETLLILLTVPVSLTGAVLLLLSGAVRGVEGCDSYPNEPLTL